MTAPRVHPAAWWCWAGALAAAATSTTNVLLLALLAGVVVLTVTVHGPDGARGFGVYAAVAGLIFAVRVSAHILLATPGAHVLVDLPALDLGPFTLLGPLTRESLLAGVSGGLQLAVLVLAVGAAHTIADAGLLLRHVPAALGPVAIAAVIAVAAFPALVRSVLDTREALRLRGVSLTGRPARDRRSLERVVVPVLEGAIERAFATAMGMEARGFGSRATVRRGAPVLMLGSLAASALALLALLDGAWPAWSAPVLAVVAGMLTWIALGGGRGRLTTVHRPPRWTPLSLGVVGCGIVAAVGVVLAPAAVRGPAADAWLALSAAALGAALVAVLPALVPPATPGRRRAQSALTPAGDVRGATS
ncbi:energy-coupling factor transporter transmembrane component T [Sanguibacter sp. A247]|uniref:energy-coupling factor transporter transmembrane component T n=1 Tax=unclassified Sanguibacter TaxID=2645534 RepID=UPI003FD87EBB